MVIPKLYYHYIEKIIPPELVYQIICFKDNLETSIINDDLNSFHILVTDYKTRNNLQQYELSHLISVYNSVKILKYIVKHNLNINYNPRNLFTCVRYKRYKICKIFLQRFDYDPNVFNSMAIVPLFLSLKSNDLKMSKILLNNGADLDIQLGTGYYILQQLIRLDILVYIKSKEKNINYFMNNDILQLCLDYNPNLNIENNKGNTLLVQLILLYNLNFVDKKKDVFIMRSSYDMIEMILLSGYNPNQCGSSKLYPLFAAVILDRVSIAKLLLEYKASTEITYKGVTLLEMSQSEKMTKLLEKYGATKIKNIYKDSLSKVSSCNNIENIDVDIENVKNKNFILTRKTNKPLEDDDKYVNFYLITSILAVIIYGIIIYRYRKSFKKYKTFIIIVTIILLLCLSTLFYFKWVSYKFDKDYYKYL